MTVACDQSPRWRVERRLRDTWHVVLATTLPEAASAAYQKLAAFVSAVPAVRRGGVRLVAPDGAIAASYEAP